MIMEKVINDVWWIISTLTVATELYFEFWSKVREAQALDLRDGFDDFDMLSGPPVDVAYVPNISGPPVDAAYVLNIIWAPGALLCLCS